MYGLSTTLTFVERRDRFSVFTQPDGTEVYLEHGTASVLVPLDEVDLAQVWRDVVAEGRRTALGTGACTCMECVGAGLRDAFLKALGHRVVEDDYADWIDWCGGCKEPDLSDNLEATADEPVCSSCIENYSACNSCDELFRDVRMTRTAYETYVCSDCLNNSYAWCGVCGGYYHNDDDEHYHEDDCDCESPAQTFSVRNDGDGLLKNDTRVTVTLPAGTISAEGLSTISRQVQSAVRGLREEDFGSLEAYYEARDRVYDLSYRMHELGDQWQTKEGNFAKRLSRFAYKTFGMKLDQDLMSSVGCIARDHSTVVDFQVEVTRDLNMSPGDFAHEDSCWWGSYYEGRCALKNNGGFALRAFADDGYVTSRAWVMPLRLDDDGDLVPTFDTENPDAYVVFNGYHNGSGWGYTPARIVSHMTGWTYRKIGFECRLPRAAEHMYVNSGAGYLVAPEEIASRYTDGHLTLSVDHHSSLYADTHKELTHV